MINFNTTISIITLNTNQLKVPIRRLKLLDWIEKSKTQLSGAIMKKK